MRLERIRLADFRNYELLDLCFDEGINLLVGENAQGKSNLLEAVYLLATGRSYRGAGESELTRWGTDGFSVRGQVSRSYGEVVLEVAYQNDRRKRIRVNGAEVRRLSELFGYLTAVIFSPEDLQLIKGGPVHRRRFLDLELAQIDAAYRQDLIDYHQVLAQRNNLLKGASPSPGELAVWEEQLAALGARIQGKRARTVAALSRMAGLAHGQITAGREELRLTYLAAAGAGAARLPVVGEPGVAAEWPAGEFHRRLAEEFPRVRPAEVRRGMTLLGPHRDDLLVEIDRASARTFASQGQQRTAALALKLGELEFMRAETGECPLLLLDDVMSELDEGRRRFLLQAAGERTQVFVTTTSRESLLPAQSTGARLFAVRQGKILPGGEPLWTAKSPPEED